MGKKIKDPARQGRTATVFEMIFSLLMMPMALNYISNEMTAQTPAAFMRVYLILAFMFMMGARLMRARRMRLTGQPKGSRPMQFVYAGAFLLCALIAFFVDFTLPLGGLTQEEIEIFSAADERQIAALLTAGDTRQLVSLVFWIAMIIGRIVAIRLDRRRRSIILNAALILLMLVWAAGAFLAREIIGTMTVATYQSLFAILGVVFFRLRLDVLRKIVRKTYASEIILGLLLLMCAFSYVLSSVEPAMPSFLDSMWYCFAIVTTIGFGDVTAVTPLGRVLSVVLGVYGIVVVALITSIIVNFYGEVRKGMDDDRETALPEGPEAQAADGRGGEGDA